MHIAHIYAIFYRFFIYISYTVILIKEGEYVNKFGIYYASSFIIEQICSILLIFRHLLYLLRQEWLSCNILKDKIYALSNFFRIFRQFPFG